MGTTPLLDVVIDAFHPGVDAVGGLMRVFGIDVATAQTIVGRVPVIVKRSVTLEAAQPFEAALRAIGAQVTLRPAAGVEPRRPAGAIETSLMHGGGWQSGTPTEQHQRMSLPVPSPQVAALPLAKTFEFMDDVSPQGWPVSRSTPPPAIDPNARTAHFAEDLMLPWVGSSPEPPRDKR